MYLVELSPDTNFAPTPNPDPIHLVTQFYLPKNTERLAELQEALRRNATNPHLETITLLNERFYNEDELGICSPKIVQTLVPGWINFSELFAPRRKGYTVVANADIFLDETIAHVRNSDLHCAKSMCALLRYEFTCPDLHRCPIFGPRADSADTWIVHSNHALPLQVFNFEMGRPGCDNKLNYLFRLLGFDVYNDPKRIRTYHCHKEDGRKYIHPAVPPPYMLSIPVGFPDMNIGFANGSSGGKPVRELTEVFNTFDMETSNQRLLDYIHSKNESGVPYVIPRIAGVENNAAVHYYSSKQLIAKAGVDVLKNNAGLGVEAHGDLWAFTDWYMKAFAASELYASWEPWGNYIRHIEASQRFMQSRYPKPQITTGVFDIFHFVAAGNPWTHALRGKRVLIVSPFGDLMKKQEQAYPIALFPDCELSFLTPPMTQGLETNRGFQVEFTAFCAQIDACDFDVALCSCGGYGNPICAYIYSKGKSAIYVGGVLQMYFGIYGGRWIKERKDVLNLYLTKQWTRPNVRPKGFEGIEKGCYW